EGHQAVTDKDHITHVLRLIAWCREHHKGATNEIPNVILDSEGSVGALVYAAMLIHSRLHPSAFKLIRVRSSEKARQFKIYERVADERNPSTIGGFRLVA